MRRLLTGLTTLAVASALTVAQGPAASAAALTMALWHMDDTTSTMRDASGHTYSTTLKNVRLQQTGWSGKAFGFGATAPSYVRVASSGNFNPGTSTYTISLRVKFSARPSSSVGDYDLLRKGLSWTPGGSYKVEILDTGKAYCNFRGTTELSLTNGPNLADSRWHAITCRRTSSSIQLTVDGITYTKSGSTGTIANTEAVMIGAKQTSGGDQYTGLMDEVLITKG